MHSNAPENDLRQVLNLHRGAHEILNRMGSDGDPAEVYEQFAFDQLPEAQGLNGHDAFRALENSFAGEPVSDRAMHLARGLSQSASTTWAEVTEASTFREFLRHRPGPDRDHIRTPRCAHGRDHVRRA
jgi:hypothetical protein